ncbi:MAG: four helix bundle protein [Bacteroidetes bacterium 43-16]|nr:MAG: four helix bundle protein [Bacteroidetes bacterium 43-16]
MSVESTESNIILKLTIEFSLEVIDYVAILESQRQYVIANQLLKSATSIGVNAHEAQNAESKLDFIHKFKIAAKEVEETKYWLILCNSSSHYPDASGLQEKLEVIKRIINRIIASSKNINQK